MVTSYQVSDMFLQALGAPINAGTRKAIALWLRFESGGTVIGNNPWNLHAGAPCTKEQNYCPGQGNLVGQIGNRWAGSGDKNVAVFDTLQHGVQANASNLKRVKGAGYEAAITQIKSGSGQGFLTAIQNSGWSAGHYGYRKLVDAFLSSNTYNYNLNIVGVAGTGGKDGGGGSGSGTTKPPPGDLTGFQVGFDWSRITAASLASLGISTDPTHVVSHEEALKLATLWPGTQYPASKIAQQFENKTVSELLNLAKGINLDVGGAIAAVGAQIGDTFTWIGVILVGIVLLIVGGFLLMTPSEKANA